KRGLARPAAAADGDGLAARDRRIEAVQHDLPATAFTVAPLESLELDTGRRAFLGHAGRVPGQHRGMVGGFGSAREACGGRESGIRMRRNGASGKTVTKTPDTRRRGR